jgi:hypothetical protein
MSGITQTLPTRLVILTDSTTPAMLNLIDGTFNNAEILLNQPHWEHLPNAYKDFIIAHEEGHFFLKTYSEFEADRYAFEKLAGSSPGSLLSMYDSLVEILPFSGREQCYRFAEMYRNIMTFNYEKSNDKKYLKEISDFNKKFEKYMGKTISFYGYNPMSPLDLAGSTTLETRALAAPVITISTDNYWIFNGVKSNYLATGTYPEIDPDGYFVFEGASTGWHVSNSRLTIIDGFWAINGEKTQFVAGVVPDVAPEIVDPVTDDAETDNLGTETPITGSGVVAAVASKKWLIIAVVAAVVVLVLLTSKK